MQEGLAHQGEPGDEMYIVVSGAVSVLVKPANQHQAREVARRHSGDYVGEMAVISQTSSSRNADRSAASATVSSWRSY